MQSFHLHSVSLTLVNFVSKSISYAVWCPDIARAHVTLARGIHFSSMGHSAPRSVLKQGEAPKIHKRLELLPEEALYLVERGSLFVTKHSSTLKSVIPGMDDIDGAPMSVQQAFAEMIGTEDLSLEKYQVLLRVLFSVSFCFLFFDHCHQVFAYLKRLGFSVTRAEAPTSYYPSAQPYVTHRPTTSFLQRLSSWFHSYVYRFHRLLMNWWRPLRLSGWLRHDKNYRMVSHFIPTILRF